ncbi:unnamed protein product [Euphydryas editha]|uniref:Uncharacterized protein n=1 Tax=Euphydryas editha TaxID=104508 RepID=A0AAU9TQS0_EUPED|nr:unnamed protein product [Euphydryas editha]
MLNNKFIGPEQNHYIVGDIVDLYYNTYQGDLQVHEVGGYIFTALMTVFDGQYRFHQYLANQVMVMDSESKGFSFGIILRKNPPKSMYDLYPNVLSHYKTGVFNDLEPQGEHYYGKMSPVTFDLTPRNATRFLEEVKLGSKIKRPADALIVQQRQVLIYHQHIYSSCNKNRRKKSQF